MEKNFTIPIVYCRMISAVAGKTPNEAKMILSGAGIDDGELTPINKGVTLENYAQIHKNARKMSKNEAIALSAGLRLPLTAHGPLGVAFATSPTLRAALEVSAEFVKTRGYFCTLKLTDYKNSGMLEIEIDDEISNEREAMIDFIMASFVNIIHSTTLYPLSQLDIRFNRNTPQQFDAFKKVLPCKLNFNADFYGIGFPSELLDFHLAGDDKEAFSAAKRDCGSLLRLQKPVQSTQKEIEKIFKEFPGKIWKLAEVAEHLNISPRTLQRRLHCEGVGYQEILDDFLQNLAIQYLKDANLSVEVIASLIGYHDAVGFRRSFRRWFDCTPTDFR